MARKPSSKQDDPAESKRFAETAKAVGADASLAVFERAFSKVVPAKSQPQKSKKK